jgi:hypothetical protein
VAFAVFVGVKVPRSASFVVDNATRTTMNVYGDVITNQDSEALAKIARLTFVNCTQAARGTA